jgi:hypothetical protein
LCKDQILGILATLDASPKKVHVGLDASGVVLGESTRSGVAAKMLCKLCENPLSICVLNSLVCVTKLDVLAINAFCSSILDEFNTSLDAS